MLQTVCTGPRIFSKFACQTIKHLTVKKIITKLFPASAELRQSKVFVGHSVREIKCSKS